MWCGVGVWLGGGGVNHGAVMLGIAVTPVLGGRGLEVCNPGLAKAQPTSSAAKSAKVLGSTPAAVADYTDFWVQTGVTHPSLCMPENTLVSPLPLLQHEL